MHVRRKPVRDRLVVTQAGDQAQQPTRKIQHAVHKSTTITIQQTQNDHYNEQQVDRIKLHDESLPSDSLNHTSELSQFKISNVTEFLDSLLGSLRDAANSRSQISALNTSLQTWNMICIGETRQFVSP